MTDRATTYHLVRPSVTVRRPGPRRAAATRRRPPTTARSSCWPAPAPARPRRWSRRSCAGSTRAPTPTRILALTFSRKAAEQLRDRVAARVGRTMSASIGSTFHSFAYGLIRRYAPAELYVGPLRLLSAPEQDVVLRELLQDHPESIRWPDELRHALGTRGFAREVHAVLSRAREKGLDGDELQRLGEANGLPEFVAAGAFLEQYLTVLDGRGAVDYSDLIRRATIEATVHRDELRAAYAHVFVDEYQDTDTGQVALLRTIAGDGRDLVVVGDPHQSIYAFRGAEVRGVLDFPTDFPRADGSPAEVVALGTTRRFGPRLLTAAQRVAGRIGLPGSIPESAREAFLAPAGRGGGPRRGSGHGPHLRQRPGRGRAPGRPAPAGAPRGRHRLGRDGRAGAVRPPVHPAAASFPRRRRRAGRGGQRRGAAGPRPGRAAADRRPAGGAQPRQRRPRPRRPHRRRAGRGAADRPVGRVRRGRRTPPGPAAAPAREGVGARRAAAAGALARAGPPRRGRRGHPRRADRSGGAARHGGGRPRARHPRAARRRARPPRSCSGRSGRAPRGRAGCAARSSSVAGEPAGRTATSTRSAPCSTRRRAPRRPATTSASGSSSPPWSPSRSRPTRWPSGARAAPPYAC